MWPWGHLAVGYLLYAGIVWYRERRVPGDVPALALALGTQAPDLVDKPLGWYLGVLPGGRSLAHSLFAVGIVVGVAVTVVRVRGEGAAWVAFAVGYASHSVTDAISPLADGNYADLAYLVWPALSLPESGEVHGLLSAIQAESYSLFFFVQLGLLAGAGILWVRHGQPGVGTVQGWIRQWRARA